MLIFPRNLARWYLDFSAEVTDFCGRGSPSAESEFLTIPGAAGV